MTELKRQVLPLGGLPFAGEEDAMSRALDALGADSWVLSDGEIAEKSEKYPLGNRAVWVQAIIDVCEQDTENWAVVNPGA